MAQQYVVTGNAYKLPMWVLHSPEITFMGDSVDESKVVIYVNGVKANIDDIIVLENNKISLIKA